MAKPELEFFRPEDLPWQPVAGSATAGVGGPGTMAGVLSRGDVTRLLHFKPGVETRGTIVHDFWEEVWLPEGSLIDRGERQTFSAGRYACRRPGMRHGPYRSPGGALLFETWYRRDGMVAKP